MWREQRRFVKEMVRHVLVFVALFGTLEGFHWITGKSQLDRAHLIMLDKFHFWSSIVLMVIFAISLVIKAVLFEMRILK